MTHVLETERLRLRTLALIDAAFYLELVNVPAFIEYIGERGIRTLPAARQAIVDGPMAMQRALGHSLCLVELKHDGTPIGICGLIKRDTLPHVDIGYAFMPHYGGQGYATEAAAGVLAHAAALGIRRVLAITSPGNAGSKAVLRKIGMRFKKIVYLAPGDPETLLYSYDC
ncbi:GNAT family N-acetyltransferase [Massilia psychrophila]|jgi:RimJ/RimL family protein N-acetyltransferase|uniref:GNAT family N-acetyltransferase n=1 Tax=Massilia psychrophila TaxID=1603353 RepID=A0A2G8T0H3_9BURK|nr:GNAT family N-acetyltransferase [Massilia psychrophila]PIL39453.1 GNAT family N-acetyltransferase [Massilia psychrophila]GGE76738.1 N-acetyltransferase [Massilia psychrophila]